MFDGGLGSSALLRATIVAILTTGSIVATSTALAQTQEEAKVRFEIPAGPLASALQRYAESAAVQLVYDSELVAGLTTAGFTETLTAREGLQRLLEGSRLVAKYSGRTITLAREKEADGRRVLGPVRVEGATAEGVRPVRGEGISTLIGERGAQDQETRGLRPVIVSVGAGVPTPIEDVPRSISVITQEQIDLQEIDDIGEALRRTPGITLMEVPSDSAGDMAFQVYSRGQRVELFQVDGGAPRSMFGDSEDLIGPIGTLDLAAYERVEVVHGPAGAQVGGGGTQAGSAGGVLNLVRKRPGAEARDSVSMTLGSFDQRKLSYDVSRPELFGTPIAARGVVSWSDTKFPYDGVRNEGRSFYGIVDIPMSEQSRIEFSLQHNRARQDGTYQGVTRFLDGPLMWGSDFNPLPEWAYADTRSTEVGGRLSIDLPRHWSFRVQGSHVNSDAEVLSYVISPVFVSATGLPPRGALPWAVSDLSRSATRSFLVDAALAGQWEFLGLRHSLSFGADFSDRSSYVRSIQLARRNATSLTDLLIVPDAPPPMRSVSDNFPPGQGAIVRSAGLSVSDMISWRDYVDLTLSLRRNFSTGNSSSLAMLANGGLSTSMSVTGESPAWIPSYWLTIKPFEPLSIGMSYAEGSRDQSTNFTRAGNPLGPATYENLEAIVKYATPNWLASVSYYEMDTAGGAQAVVPSDFTCRPSGGSTCFEEGEVSQHSRGIDVEWVGRVAAGVDLIASYNRNENELVVTGKPIHTQTPTTMAKLFASWQPAHWPRLRVHGGAAYRDSVYASGQMSFYGREPPYPLLSRVPYDYTVDSYVSFDVGASYRINDALEVSLFVENVTDELYLSTISSSSFYGKPRSFTLEVKAHDLASRLWRSAPRDNTTFLGQGWYSTFEIGLSTPSDITAKSSGPASTGERTEWQWGLEGQHALFGRLGRNIGTHWQAEIEAGARSFNFTSIGESSGMLGICANAAGTASYPACDDPGGVMSVASLLGNVIYRFGDSNWRVRPYIGAGLGGARVAVGVAGRAREDAETGRAMDVLGGVEEDYVFAGQLLAGAFAQITPRLSADLSYRHFQTGHAEWVVIGGPRSSAIRNFSKLGSFGGRIEAGALTLGLRYAFAD